MRLLFLLFCFDLNAMFRSKYLRFQFFFVFFLFATIFSLSAQVTIWSEDFNSYPNGTENGTGTGVSAANWYTTIANEVWVQGGQIEANNTNGAEGVWYTDPINVIGYSGVQFSMDVATQADTFEFEAGTDYFVGEYSVDGGATWVEFENASGDTDPALDALASSYTVNIPDGSSTLIIRVRFYNTFDNEFYFIDNVIVTGVAGGGGTGVETSGCAGYLNYKFYDLPGNLLSVDDLPVSGEISAGIVSDFDVDALQADSDPGDSDNYGVRYEGYIYIDVAGTYTFYANSNNGSKIFIDGNEVVNNDHDGPTQERFGSIFLTSGFHAIEIPFFENRGQQVLEIYYENTALSIIKQLVPFSILHSCLPGLREIVATGDQYYCDNSPTQIVESVAITSTGANELNAAYIQISSGYDLGEDLLSVASLPSGISSSWNATEGKLTLSGLASLSDYESAISSVTFESTNVVDDTVKEFSIVLATANYLLATGHYYEYVPDLGITWTDARDQAALRTFNGLQGYLATITISEEAVLLGEQASGAGWIGASDAAVEGEWFWVTGPEAGDQFWQGGVGGVNVGPYNYSNWNNNEPNNQGDEDYAHINAPGTGFDGSWNDLSNTGASSGAYQPKGFLVEYGGMPGDPEPPKISAVTSLTYGDPVILTQPSNQVVFAGDDATFTADVSKVKVWQWEVSTDGGATWNIIDGGDNPTALTATLVVSEVQVSQEDERYRVVVGNSGSGCNLVTSNEAALSVRVRTIVTNRNKTFRVSRNN